jgi:hypothetical protein
LSFAAHAAARKSLKSRGHCPSSRAAARAELYRHSACTVPAMGITPE